MGLVVVVQIILDILTHPQTHETFDKLFIHEPCSTVFLLVLLQEGVGCSHVAKIELLTDVNPSSLFKGALSLTETVLIEFLSIVIQAAEFLLVVIEDGLDVTLLEDFFHEFLI